MGFNEQTDRTGILESCRDLLRFQAMFSRHFMFSPTESFGKDGEQAMRAALERYGAYRAGITRRNVEAAGLPLTAANAFLHWDMADVHLLSELVPGSVTGSEEAVTLELHDCAEWERWREYPNGLAIARCYYGSLLPAIAAGLGLEAEFELAQLDLKAPWSVRWTLAGVPAGPVRVLHSALFDDRARALGVTRQTAMNNGALYYFCADEQTRRFDMIGETALRGQCQALGIERARRQKAAHLAAGWELDLKTLMDHWDGQLVSLWQFKPGVLTQGVWHQDCTVCPYADVWGGFGPRALDLGYLYDKEMHTTYYHEYHPDMRVQFSAIKTRGDSFCGFRVSMPSRAAAGEPQFEGYTGVDV